MEKSFPHLTLKREAPITEKRPGRFPPPSPPSNRSQHGKKLQKRLQHAKG